MGWKKRILRWVKCVMGPCYFNLSPARCSFAKLWGRVECLQECSGNVGNQNGGAFGEKIKDSWGSYHLYVFWSINNHLGKPRQTCISNALYPASSTEDFFRLQLKLARIWGSLVRTCTTFAYLHTCAEHLVHSRACDYYRKAMVYALFSRCLLYNLYINRSYTTRNRLRLQEA